MRLSVIYPMHNEAGNIEELLKRTYDSLVSYFDSPNDFEIICVDDHSTDQTKPLLNENIKKYPNLKILEMKKNKGHAFAINEGFKNVSNSKYTFLSDSDLQYNPEEIVKFLDFIKNNPDVEILNGWRKKEKHESFLKIISSKIYNKLCRILFKLPTYDNASNFTLYKTKHIKDLDLEYNDQRYIIAILRFKFKIDKLQIVEIPVTHKPRIYGKSKYPVWRKMVFGIFEIFKKRRELKKSYS